METNERQEAVREETELGIHLIFNRDHSQFDNYYFALIHLADTFIQSDYHYFLWSGVWV